jgi:DNA polymerase I-like protein with 3'-5' exonuclease and polymerase domains
MGPYSLAARLGADRSAAVGLLGLHRRTYPTYWRWSDAVERTVFAQGRLRTALGWTLHVDAKANPRSVRNFPLQATGAEMLQLACIALTEAGVRVCAPVHDALLVEADEGDIGAIVERTREAMARASEAVLGGFRLRTDAKSVRYPDRYMDERGRAMWQRVFGRLGTGERRAAA